MSKSTVMKRATLENALASYGNGNAVDIALARLNTIRQKKVFEFVDALGLAELGLPVFAILLTRRDIKLPHESRVVLPIIESGLEDRYGGSMVQVKVPGRRRNK